MALTLFFSDQYPGPCLGSRNMKSIMCLGCFMRGKTRAGAIDQRRLNIIQSRITLINALPQHAPIRNITLDMIPGLRWVEIRNTCHDLATFLQKALRDWIDRNKLAPEFQFLRPRRHTSTVEELCD